MVAAIIREIELQKNYLEDKTLSSVYLGGGTPSLLSPTELDQIFEAIHRHYQLTPDAEITLEANPDDLNPKTLKALADSPVNRLSIGIQSFDEADLKFMNRAHNAAEAMQCISLAREAGFDQFTVDLIYGSPTTSDAQWAKNLEILFDFKIKHLSCYCLTVEPGTALSHFVAKGKTPPVDEEKAARHLDHLIKATAAEGFIHYEISNFAQEGHFAQHNSAYWKGEPYLGVGPSAHSFDGQSRQWNIAHNPKYLKSIAANQVPFEREILSSDTRYNEYVMTGLRTIWGVSLEQLKKMGERYVIHFEKGAEVFLRQEKMEKKGDRYRLSTAGKFIADHIAMELFWEENQNQSENEEEN